MLKDWTKSFDFIFMDAAKGQYIHFMPEVLRLLADGGTLVSDNVMQDGDIIESRFAVERRNRTIHARMREYLYELKHNEELVTSITAAGGRRSGQHKKRTVKRGNVIERIRKWEDVQNLLIPASSLEVLKTAVIFGADAVYIGGEAFRASCKGRRISLWKTMKEGIAFAHEHRCESICYSQYTGA